MIKVYYKRTIALLLVLSLSALLMSGCRKRSDYDDASVSVPDTYASYDVGFQNNIYEKAKSENKRTDKKPVEKYGAAQPLASKQPELSQGAKDLLNEMQKKYGDRDFFVADYSSDDEAQRYLSRGSKEYSVLIEPELLEKMAADESVKGLGTILSPFM